MSLYNPNVGDAAKRFGRKGGGNSSLLSIVPWFDKPTPYFLSQLLRHFGRKVDLVSVGWWSAKTSY